MLPCCPTLPTHLFFGLDLGRLQNPSAIALLERRLDLLPQRDPATFEPYSRLSFILRHTEIVPLGTPYLNLLRHVRRLLHKSAAELGASPAEHPCDPYRTLVLDASGVGDPVAELFRLSDIPANFRPITITPSGEPSSTHVPRSVLLTNLRLLLERQLLHIPRGLPHYEALCEQLVRLRPGKTRFPDDLAMALALAAWGATTGVTPLIHRVVPPSPQP